jgi:general stress protein YciG
VLSSNEGYENGIKVMAQKGSKGNIGTKGFASMDEERKKHMASRGGHASAKGRNTSNRGFASMDKDKQREISSMGGRASQSMQGNRPGRNEEDAELNGIINERGVSERDLNSLEDEDSLESSRKTQGSLAYSETDEDEDEGLGDGNLGRSTQGGVSGK